ncbi:mitochondrial resolvase Ydc2 [Xylaria intraflava]|nr:mitochondrial resolvase Ydc2 [Xylaria intraflava]
MPAASSSRAMGAIPRTLRVSDLQRLSSLCGLPTSGRKDDLIARLSAVRGNASSRSNPGPAPVILSIDLGIKNLAFSLMTPASPVSPRPKVRSKYITTDQSPISPPAIKLHAWKRLSLLPDPADVSPQDGGGPMPSVGSSAEFFAPAAMAKTANAFLQETVLQLKPLPTCILIERQRWRSQSSAAIQEWTVRVNTLEAMFHASLKTLRDFGAWEGDVVSVQPARVSQLFLYATKEDTGRTAKIDKKTQELEEGEIDASDENKPTRKRKTSRKTSAETKKLKIELLGSWLGQGDRIIQPGNLETGHMLDGYRLALEGNNRSKGGRRSKSKRATEETEAEKEQLMLGKKLDDVTDSLMQGMAWLRWQENLSLLQLESGAEKLLE